MSMIFPAVYASCNDYHSEFSLTDDYSRNIIPEKHLLVTDITLLYNIVEVRFLSNVQYHTTNKNVLYLCSCSLVSFAVWIKSYVLLFFR